MISVERLSKRYGSIRAVEDLSFEARPGEVLGFLGPNGAGKSTTMRILTGFLSPTSGRATVCGHDVVEDSIAVRRRTGYLPEHTPVYTDMTVAEFLRFVAEARGVPWRQRKAAVGQAMDDCGLSHVTGRLIGHLSKGYRQRTCFAQALVHRPDVLILDEPTSGLDPNQIVEIRDLVCDLARQRTIVWSTHILSEVEALCERVLIVSEGRAVALGAPDALRSSLPGARALSITLHTETDSATVTSKLESLAGVDSALPSPEKPGDYTIHPAADADPRDAIVELAASVGWKLRALTPLEPSLEDVFRHVTGTAVNATDAEALSSSIQGAR